LPPAARGTLFEKTVPLDPLQKLLIIFFEKKKKKGQTRITENFLLFNERIARSFL
jgi:hypothetical protein